VDDPQEGFADEDRIARSNCKVSRERIMGYRAGMGQPDLPVFEATGNFFEDGVRAAHVVLTRSPRPTVLLCATDVLAFGAMHAARELGLDVPGDVSITGFDDVPAAATADLTTVRQQLQEKGRQAGRLLLERDTEREVILPLELVTRGSTGPAPT
jgi:DNA-binding LacI/PurR family transcriptional regulator